MPKSFLVRGHQKRQLHDTKIDESKDNANKVIDLGQVHLPEQKKMKFEKQDEKTLKFEIGDEKVQRIDEKSQAEVDPEPNDDVRTKIAEEFNIPRYHKTQSTIRSSLFLPLPYEQSMCNVMFRSPTAGTCSNMFPESPLSPFTFRYSELCSPELCSPTSPHSPHPPVLDLRMDGRSTFSNQRSLSSHTSIYAQQRKECSDKPAMKPLIPVSKPCLQELELINGGYGIKNPLISQVKNEHSPDTYEGVRPYKCDHCGKAFTQRCSLESHCRKVHSIEFKFGYKERRNKLYVCEECGYTTDDPGQHFVHLKKYHPQSPVLLKVYDKRQFKFSEPQANYSDVMNLSICR
ncbi:hypothetical protein FSP39_008605 [Pinctada imbricata]|uniref:C2H2-type domain-containing protein n=1 Tax=Pinctada imbricata TaxID=66713 RepID=A0AA89C8M9_PINIB|nr:hypothetical protein FSP39_008605 [Pinctada imbricata]